MLPSIFGENLFDDFFDFPFESRALSRSPLYGKHEKNLMKTDVRETKNTYELDIDLPGFRKEDIRAQVSNGYLTVTASKDLDKEEKNKEGRYIRRERYCGQCSRSFYIGENVQEKDVKAKFEDGILRISIPRQEVKELPGQRIIEIE